MAERERLHQLVDRLPDGALPPALQMLERLQNWPPQPPPEIQRMHEEMRGRGLDRFRGSSAGGAGGWVGGGGGALSLSSLGDIRNGHFVSSHLDGTDQVVATRRFHEGHELQIRERFRLAKEGKALIYIQEIAGLRRQVSHEVEFEIDEPEAGGAKQ